MVIEYVLVLVQKRDIESLKKFLRKTRPAVVVVGANGRCLLCVAHQL